MVIAIKHKNIKKALNSAIGLQIAIVEICQEGFDCYIYSYEKRDTLNNITINIKVEAFTGKFYRFLQLIYIFE